MTHQSSNSRAVAARVLARMAQGRALDDALAESRVERHPQASFIKALVYGVTRERRLLDALLDRLLSKPLSDELLRPLLLIGLQQLRAMDVAAHAALNETVDAVHALQREPARTLVNAVLRRFQREHEQLEAQLADDPGLRSSHPDWLVQQLQRDWPQRWREILAANNVPGPLGLRVNRRLLTREAWLERVAGIGIAAHAVPACADAAVLEQPRPVAKIPGFNSGQVSVQDAAAQLAADLLDLSDGLRVLDACAAPGGKTAHLLERHALELTALDIDAQRLIRVDENLRRLKLGARLIAGDATEPARWWDGKAFDRILVDAPCSGTGVIRRHPDIKWLRRESDIPTLAAQQQRLLRALWPLLAPGGRLVYATCSVLAAEGDAVIETFLGETAQAGAKPIAADWGEPCRHGRRLAPGGDFDGFYYAVLLKPGAAA